MSDFRIIEGDALETLRGMESCSFDACLTDPPYALTSGKKGGSGAKSINLNHPGGRSKIGTGNGVGGFMGMAWDAAIPGPEVWRELLRVLRPGAPLLAFGGARTFHRLACAIEDGGFILTDTLCWLHGQGFPKGKSQLKPAWEPITLAWKEGKRALNIDDCRIETSDKISFGNREIGDGVTYNKCAPHGEGKQHNLGRWPANVILDEEAAKALDEQSGILTSGNSPAKRSSDKHRKVYAGWNGEQCLVHRGTDSGGASRFFYCAKAKGSERVDNEHPTVKPTALTEYLARLILVPGATSLLVPFSGSGSEMIGALRAGWSTVTGIEREREYIHIAQRRMRDERVPGTTESDIKTVPDLPLFAEVSHVE